MPIPVLPFVAKCKFPEETNPKALIREHTGIRVKYQVPNSVIDANVARLFNAFRNYDDKPSPATEQALVELCNTLGFVVNRMVPFNPDDPNVVFVYPAGKRNGTPVINVYGISFQYRFGAMKIPNQPETYANPVNAHGITSPHEGTDGALDSALAEFALGDKFLLFNAAHKESAKPVRSTYQKSRYASDASHAKTLFVPFLKEVFRVWPFISLSVNHGLADKNARGKPREMKMWVINSYDGKFVLSEQKDTAALTAIALAQFDYPNRRCIAIGSQLPYRVIGRDGVSRPLTTPQPNINSFFTTIDHPPNTDVPGHMANGSNNGKSRGRKLGRVAHKEHGGYFKKDGKPLDIAMQAEALVRDWEVRWDPRVHTLDPTKMPAEVVNNIRLFPAWFQHQLTLVQPLRFTRSLARAAAIPPVDDDEPYSEVDSDAEFSVLDASEDEADVAPEAQATTNSAAPLPKRARLANS